ncbi:NAD(P)/FAD-dependent oxidoreductase [Lacimicrobium alkaliphilum]|uniref:FAD-dependent oxidoreductase n=1 Tax=Lacimicrobium alkaliphilum TaxID=1526571 RepID=A0ABQ1QYX3_9ALTE|nr:FAD-binding oxidoreductase [Lacimicrobium alkaliphilum]GGD50609.1 FAD-dependent oxidoreductase [Lacimicrobium alkaliphilum]
MYDPLTTSSPGIGEPYPESYWAKNVQTPTPNPLIGHIDTPVAIIGAGYTGLSCAWHLAKNYQIPAVVLEANQIGWGCSGRNAGFVLNGTGRLSWTQIQSQWGAHTANRLYAEYRQGIDTVTDLIEQGKIACDKQTGGYLKVAHKASLVSGLQQQAGLLQQQFQDPVRFIDAKTLQQQYLNSEEAHGALLFPYCFGIQPLKLARGYAQLACEQGAQLYSHSPVTQWHKDKDKTVLTTSEGTVSADKVVIATNGYTPRQFHPGVDNRHFPVLSSVIVTEPLTDQQLKACGLKAGLMVMDTRSLKYYYRLLPDNRILFGGRGAIRGKDANHPCYRQRLLGALIQSFPQLRELQVAHFWSGWVSVSLDDYPRICQADEAGNLFYSMGYCGSGVSFSTQAGKRLAQRVAGDNTLPDLPFFQSPLPRFPLARARRVGLWAFYHFGRLKDRFG